MKMTMMTLSDRLLLQEFWNCTYRSKARPRRILACPPDFRIRLTNVSYDGLYKVTLTTTVKRCHSCYYYVSTYLIVEKNF